MALAPESTGLDFNCSNMAVVGSKEHTLAAAIPQLVHLPSALRAAYGDDGTTATVRILRGVGLPRTSFGADVVHTHPAFFERQHNNQALDDVAFQGVDKVAGVDVTGLYYGQVIAVGTLKYRPFVFCQCYASAGTASSNPVRMQPLVWERPAGASKGPADGVFMALDVATLQYRACIVPDFEQGDGHFFVNHLVHDAEAHLPKEVKMYAVE